MNISLHKKLLYLNFQGCLPLVLMFDMKEEIEVEPQFITQLMEQLDVFISLKPKPKQPSKVNEKLIFSLQTVMYALFIGSPYNVF